MDYLTTRTSLSPIRHGFTPSFVSYKKGCTRLEAASDKVYQLLAHGRWFSPGTPASSTTKTGRHDIAEILLKVALNTKNHQIKNVYVDFVDLYVATFLMAVCIYIYITINHILYLYNISSLRNLRIICICLQ